MKPPEQGLEGKSRTGRQGQSRKLIALHGKWEDLFLFLRGSGEWEGERGTTMWPKPGAQVGKDGLSSTRMSKTKPLISLLLRA